MLDAAAIAFLAVLEWTLYRKVLRLWFTFDDPWTLHTITEHSARAVFLDRAVWPQKLYTPLLMMTFKAETALFGLNPRPWYVVQLAILFAASACVYFAARRFLDVVPALLLAGLFVAGGPMSAVVTQLSTVHYLIAIALASISVVLWVTAVKRGSNAIAIASAIVYFAAMLAKEVSVPLPLLLVVLPVNDWRSRLRASAPHGIALIGFLALRRSVIGEFLGSYNFVIAPGERIRVLLSLPMRLAAACGLTGFVPGILLGALLVTTVVFAIRSRNAIVATVIGLAVAIVPLFPAAKEVHRRYGLVPWLACAAVFAASIAVVRSGRVKALVATAALVLTIVVNRHVWATEFATRHRMSNEARFFFEEMPPDAFLRDPLAPGAVLRELNWLKSVRLGRGSGGTPFYDDLYLCTHDLGGRRVFEYDAKLRMIRDISSGIPRIRDAYCRSIRNDVPLSAAFHFRHQALFWSFGPYVDGTYSIVLGDGVEAFPVARSDAQFLLEGGERFSLRIRYASPAGWTTYSPELAFDFLAKPDVVYQRMK